MMTKSERVDYEQAKGLAKWFELDVTIKIFGHVIWSWHFPPDKLNS